VINPDVGNQNVVVVVQEVVKILEDFCQRDFALIYLMFLLEAEDCQMEKVVLG
jgi:hypothetical protein